MAEAVNKLLLERDGLMLGICNGFQALIKLGLAPYGEIRQQNVDSPTLTYNTIGRHISKMVYTKVVTNNLPGWRRQSWEELTVILLPMEKDASLPPKSGWISCLPMARWQPSM